MEKLVIKPTLQQISPALPDPNEFAERIFESIIFMDENRKLHFHTLLHK